MTDMEQKRKEVREAEIRAKIAKLDAYVEEMNAKGDLTDEEKKESTLFLEQPKVMMFKVGFFILFLRETF